MAKRVLKRAAGCAALFASGITAALLIGAFDPGQALARMRDDRLTIEPASGGGPRAFDIEVADTAEEKALGLMFRTALADDHGMLFFYGPPLDVTMWMRNTYIPLDMVFIRADGVIHRIEAKAEPLSDRVIAAGAPVAAVLELAGGAAARLGIKPGDKVRHGVFGNAAASGSPAAQKPGSEAAPPGY